MENPRQQRGRRKPVPAFLRPRKVKPRVVRKAPRKVSRKAAKPVSRRVVRAVAAGVGKAALARQQAKVELRRALRTFRPKKAERGTVVFLAAKPKGGKSERLKRGSRRKGYAVYVTTTGKVKPVRDSRAPRGKRGVPKAQRLGSLDPRAGRTARERAAIEKAMFVRVRSRRGLSRMVVPGRGQTSVDWLKVRAEMTAAMARGVGMTLEAHTQVVTSAVVVAGIGTFSATTYLNVSAEQARMKPGAEWEAFQAKADEQYGIIAEQLFNHGENGLVSRGSAKYVQRIGDNEDLDQEDWTDESGNRWEKNECDIVDIASWSFEIGVGQVETRE